MFRKFQNALRVFPYKLNAVQIRFSGSKLNKVLQLSNFKKFNEIDFSYLNF